MKLIELGTKRSGMGAQYVEQYANEVLETGSFLCQDTHISLRLRIGEEFDIIEEYQYSNGTPYLKAQYKIVGVKVQFALMECIAVSNDGAAAYMPVIRANTMKEAFEILTESRKPLNFSYVGTMVFVDSLKYKKDREEYISSLPKIHQKLVNGFSGGDKDGFLQKFTGYPPKKPD